MNRRDFVRNTLAAVGLTSLPSLLMAKSQDAWDLLIARQKPWVAHDVIKPGQRVLFRHYHGDIKHGIVLRTDMDDMHYGRFEIVSLCGKNTHYVPEKDIVRCES